MFLEKSQETQKQQTLRKLLLELGCWSKWRRWRASFLYIRHDQKQSRNHCLHTANTQIPGTIYEYRVSEVKKKLLTLCFGTDWYSSVSGVSTAPVFASRESRHYSGTGNNLHTATTGCFHLCKRYQRHYRGQPALLNRRYRGAWGKGRRL